MREIDVSAVRDSIRELSIEACYVLPPDVMEGYEKAKETEESEAGKEVMEILIKNAEIAAKERMPICQDTGVAIVYLEVGQDVHFVGGDLRAAINEGVSRGYVDGYLRKSVVSNPLFGRKNTGDNTPAIVHVDIVPGDQVKITLLPKGTGSENMSALKMLTPAHGAEGVKKFVVETLENAGSNPCPPVVVGVGVGGMMDHAAFLAKKALLRPVGEPSPDPDVAQLEKEILSGINATGVGPQGFGGTVTAMAVHVETHPTHIGALPVAINVQCHAARKASKVI